jgi:hypothetical protein
LLKEVPVPWVNKGDGDTESDYLMRFTIGKKLALGFRSPSSHTGPMYVVHKEERYVFSGPS